MKSIKDHVKKIKIDKRVNTIIDDYYNDIFQNIITLYDDLEKYRF